jgi:hypothetical protein
MAYWKRLTDIDGKPVDVNLDAIIEVRRVPEDNVTLLRSAYLPEYRIAVREEQAFTWPWSRFFVQRARILVSHGRTRCRAC